MKRRRKSTGCYPTVLALGVCALLGTLLTTTAEPVSAATSSAQCRITGSGPEAWNGIDPREYHPSTGTITASMIFVDFPGSPAPVDNTPPQAFGKSRVAFATGWYPENSYGKASLDVTYDDQWTRMPKPAAEYGFGDGVTFDEQTAFLDDAVEAAGKHFDFGGRSIVYIVSAPTGGALPDSPTWIGGSEDAITTRDGTTIEWGVTTGDDLYDAPGEHFGAHVLAHETGHILGLPDLYTFDSSEWLVFHRYAGAWDVMGNLEPGLDLLTWHKRNLGWLRPGQWRCIGYGQSRMVEVTPDAAQDGGVKMLVTPISRSKAIVAEVRTRVGYDKDMCDPDGGVLVYTVNANTATGDGPIRIHSAHPKRDAGGDADSPCGSLSYAPYDAGQEFTGNGVSVDVRAETEGGYVVTVTNHRLPPGQVACPKGTSRTVTCKRRAGGGLTMTGTGRKEHFAGTGRADVIRGRGGADRINGRGGADRITGGPGRDRFAGGPGPDRINARGQRREVVDCGGGRDRVTHARGDRVHRNCERVSR